MCIPLQFIRAFYAAGAFDQTYDGSTVLNYIAQWDGTSWQSVGDGMNSSVNSIAFVGDTLYAGGNFTKAGGISTSYLAYWDGQNWYEAFMGTSYPVQALLATHDSLFVGGDFNYVGSETRNTGLRAQGTAMLQDGNWTPLGSGYYCNCFAMFQGSLWVGGEYYLGDGVLADEIAPEWIGMDYLFHGHACWNKFDGRCQCACCHRRYAACIR